MVPSRLGCGMDICAFIEFRPRASKLRIKIFFIGLLILGCKCKHVGLHPNHFMKKLGIFLGILFSSIGTAAYAQFTQSIIGQLVDKESKAPLHGAIIKVLGTDPLLTATSDDDGKFVIKDVKYG